MLQTPVRLSEALLAHDVYVCFERPSGALLEGLLIIGKVSCPSSGAKPAGVATLFPLSGRNRPDGIASEQYVSSTCAIPVSLAIPNPSPEMF